MRYIKNRVQLYNPRAKYWVKVDRTTGRILGHKDTPYKNIKKFKRGLCFPPTIVK